MTPQLKDDLMLKLRFRARRLVAAPVLAAILYAFPAYAAAQELTLTASDGVKIHGQVSRVATPGAPIILAFHMAGSNHAEYAPIVGKLNAAGFTVLAIDQRSGGNGFGSRNITVDGIGRSSSYDEALKDLEAAHTWAVAEARGASILVWGSSYSAALVFVLAAKNPATVAGVLSFSPGEYLGGRNRVHIAASTVMVPVFVSQSSSSSEVEEARSIVAAIKTNEKTHFVPSVSGVHGSSSLREDANPKGAQEYWSAVLDFLKKFSPA